ncbi:hypothetical protein TSOC_011426 [Tetrabaena socialis]|uniref:Uncharacterized protein n=1 Tax=Tetrabaena socialis TaxID=47790 RepID=A0A2J7ZQN7_9CHLO|nr:hypothetical protein TSOC_011426 [Tetrabaena socialis]|eukprot:PNH02585.1 hypothetical protein TSOC_011426 [Tetrabaena socialis]
MGTHDVLRVKLRANEQDIINSRIRYCMIPFVKAICPVLDRKARTLEVAPPEGLLDLTTATPLRKPLSDEAKKEKLKELQEIRKREEEARQAQPSGEPAATAAAPKAAEPSSSGAARPRGAQKQPRQQRRGASVEEEAEGAASASEDADGDADEGGGEGEGAAAEAAPARVRRPGLRRQTGGLRLGRRRVASVKEEAVGNTGEAAADAGQA